MTPRRAGALGGIVLVIVLATGCQGNGGEDAEGVRHRSRNQSLAQEDPQEKGDACLVTPDEINAVVTSDDDRVEYYGTLGNSGDGVCLYSQRPVDGPYGFRWQIYRGSTTEKSYVYDVPQGGDPIAIFSEGCRTSLSEVTQFGEDTISCDGFAAIARRGDEYYVMISSGAESQSTDPTVFRDLAPVLQAALEG